jgi:cell division protein YceG involved in septum cleavage
LWEGYREGYDDYRYIYTLEQTIAEAKKSTNASVQQKVTSAELVLQNVWNAIKVQKKYKIEGLWAPAEFDLHRWQIAQQIMDLQKVLKK